MEDYEIPEVVGRLRTTSETKHCVLCDSKACGQVSLITLISSSWAILLLL